MDNKQPIKVKLDTTWIIIIIWYIGYLFTSGYTNIETESLWEEVIKFLVLFLGWPMTLGYFLGGHAVP